MPINTTKEFMYEFKRAIEQLILDRTLVGTLSDKEILELLTNDIDTIAEMFSAIKPKL